MDPIVLIERIQINTPMKAPQMVQKNRSIAKRNSSLSSLESPSLASVPPSDEFDDDCIIIDNSPTTSQPIQPVRPSDQFQNDCVIIDESPTTSQCSFDEVSGLFQNGLPQLF